MALTDYHRNKLIDYWYRGQTYTPPTNLYIALLTAASATTYTEQTGGGVARVLVARSLAAWAGTQGDGTTTASSGTSGITSNNAQIEFAASATGSISASYVGIFDAASAGNLLDFYQIKDSGGTPITRNWVLGDPVRIPASSLRITYA
jgi:hypothetical protein